MANTYRGTGSTNALLGEYNTHLTKVAERTLLKAPVLYEFADKHPLPGGSGKTIYVPKHVSADTMRLLVEGVPIAACANSAGYYSATVAGYGDAKGYTDFLEKIREVPRTVQNDIQDMMHNAGLKIDSLLRIKLCGAGVYVQPDGSTASGAVKSTTSLKQRFLFDANTTLASSLAPRYEDGYYWGAFHPRQIHDLFVNTSSGGTNLGIANVSWLEGTEMGASKLARATMGALGGIRIFETTSSPVLTGAAAVGAISADNSGFQAYVMGRGAIGAVDLATARLKTFIKQLGSAGTADPIDQVMTAGVKFYFAAIAKDTTNRLVKTGSGKTL